MVPKVDNPSYWPVFILNAAIMLICLAILVKTTNEPKLVKIMEEESKGLEEEEETPVVAEAKEEKMAPEVKKSLFLILGSVFLWFMGYNAITTSFSKYANVYWGLQGGSYAYTLIIAQAAAIISYIPAGIVATKIGRRKTILGGVAALAIAFGSSMFFKSFSGMIFFFFVLAGAGWAFINVNSYPMVVEMSKGASVGKFTGYYYTASQTAQIITPILSGFVLEYGYLLVDQANPDAGYVLLFPYGTLFVALSFVTMLFVRHGDCKAEAKKGLAAFEDMDD
jgi:MFS family permease